MENIWNELYSAAKAVLDPRKISEMMEAGGVAAAIEAGSGKLYTGVCVDCACTLGICAERNAIFNMITNGENKIKRVMCMRSINDEFILHHAPRLVPHLVPRTQVLTSIEGYSSILRCRNICQ